MLFICFLIIFSVISFLFLSQTEIYYQYCKNSIETGDYLVKEDIDKFEAICKRNFKNYNDHILMNNTINIFYGLMNTPNKNHLLDSSDRRYLKKKIVQDLPFLNFYLQVHKYGHLVMYLITLYVVIVVFPHIFLTILHSIFEKILYIIFLIFFIEGAFNYTFNMKVDLITYVMDISNYVNFDNIGLIYKYILRMFEKIMNQNNENAVE